MATLKALQALGNVKQLPIEMKMAIFNDLEESFKVPPKPKSDDWLRFHNEQQTFNMFKKIVDKAVPDETRKTIYIQPVGPFDNPRATPINIINEFACTFFPKCDVAVLSTIDFSPNIKRRMNCGTLQYDSSGLLNVIHQTRSRRDSSRELLCVAVTMADIYPEKWNWNFAYSHGSIAHGLAICSFARLDPLFYTSSEQLHREPLTEEHRLIILRRSLKVFLFEVGYLFGLHHCVYYICLMNGANHEEELDRQTLYLCPVCLRKLFSSLEFNVRQMYVTLAHLSQEYDLEEEHVWYKRRLDCMR